jgi:hypothetical protein
MERATVTFGLVSGVLFQLYPFIALLLQEYSKEMVLSFLEECNFCNRAGTEEKGGGKEPASKKQKNEGEDKEENKIGGCKRIRK